MVRFGVDAGMKGTLQNRHCVRGLLMLYDTVQPYCSMLQFSMKMDIMKIRLESDYNRRSGRSPGGG